MHERHRSFRFTGDLRTVSYVPGALTPDGPAVLAAALRAGASRFE